jgi:HD-GYP domain-containing protein (c-di-GMP phosphodiesterase class II)
VAGRKVVLSMGRHNRAMPRIRRTRSAPSHASRHNLMLNRGERALPPRMHRAGHSPRGDLVVTLELAPAPVAPLVQECVDALAAALDRPVNVWVRDDAQWSCALESGEPLEAARHESERLVELLEAVSAQLRSGTSPIGDAQALIAAPIIDAAGALSAVAVATVDEQVASLAVRLAHSVLRERVQQQEIEWLRDENYMFSHQVTDDFEELTFLRHMATRLVIGDTSLDIGTIVEQTIAELREMIGAEAVFFVSLTASRELQLVQSCPAKPDRDAPVDPEAAMRVAQAHCDRAQTGPCVRNDLEGADAAGGVRQFLMAPISVGDRQFGWFVAVNRTNFGRRWTPSPLLQLGSDEFGTWEASLLSTAATLLASHASNLDLLREKERLLISTVRSLVTALDAKDAYTRGHSERVALFSQRIAEQMGYDSAAADRIYLSGLLHDVGKIGVSDATLRKPGKLTPEEFAEIKRHPDEGWAILRDLEQLNYVLPAVLHHHEAVRGGGYPDGLVADQIPLDARIMAVADAYDAMTSDRAYRSGMPHDTAIEILREGADSQWDANVVNAFMAAIEDIVSIRYGYCQTERPMRQGSALAPSCQSPDGA